MHYQTVEDRMGYHKRTYTGLAIVLGLACWPVAAEADELVLLKRKPDPYGFPRPAPAAKDIPVRTSFFFQIGFADRDAADEVLADSVVVQLQSEGGEARPILLEGQQFAAGYHGSLAPCRDPANALAINIDGGPALDPSTRYTVTVAARSRDGGRLESAQGSWQFTTAGAERETQATFRLDLSQPPTRWRGAFFNGFCKPSFCTSASNRLPGYELMAEIRRDSPRAWSLQRDFSPTTMSHQPRFLEGGQPNVVRELETRRITAIQPHGQQVSLEVEDFFGHEQYGIPSERSLATDYQVGQSVLIADGVSSATAQVVRIESDEPGNRRLWVTAFDPPANGWKLDYSGPLPTAEDPDAPGLFPPGGCYLRKLDPAGTPRYYWGRLDREWDIAVRQFDRRLVVNFADAPGDLAIDGQAWTYPKDYAQYHRVVRSYTSHLIERYGERCLDFVWSVANEPDLAAAFWRSGDWIELQKFYDYTVDAVLRSFEDHGFDSDRVVVGGLEIGAIFGTHIENPILKKFLCHCSPRASCEGELSENAAYADRRLDGQRSQRVERLCRANQGQGSPCDFISVHAYNSAPLMAAKLERAKQLALEVDAEYFADLWVNSFESCPGWAPPPDVAAADSYLGNGYFATWCADVARRRLAAAAVDSRYGWGESVLTFWPWPNRNFRGHNNATQVLGVDEDGDGRHDRVETVALPILRFLGLLARMQDSFWVLPEQTSGSHVVSGFAARQGDQLIVLLYSHDPADIQSRSDRQCTVALQLQPPAKEVLEYRFDRRHNSYFDPGRALRDQLSAGSAEVDSQTIERLVRDLSSGDRQLQLAAVGEASRLPKVPEKLVAVAIEVYQATDDQELRSAIEAAGRRITEQDRGFAPEDIRQIRELSQLQLTRSWKPEVNQDNTVSLSVPLVGNAASFLIIRQ